MVVRTIVVAVLGVAVRVSMVGRALGLAHVQPEAAECVAQLAQRCEEGRVEVEVDVPRSSTGALFTWDVQPARTMPASTTVPQAPRLRDTNISYSLLGDARF